MEHEHQPDPEIQRFQAIAVWIGSFESLEAGYVHGEWVLADQDANFLKRGLMRVLGTAPVSSHKWFVGDHQGFHGLTPNEQEGPDHIATLGKAIRDHGEPIAIAYDTMQCDLDALIAEWPAPFIGAFSSYRELMHVLEPEKDDLYKDEFAARESVHLACTNSDLVLAHVRDKLYAFWPR